MKSEIQFFRKERETSVGADSAANSGIIECACRGGGSIRENSRPVHAGNSKNFVMSPSRFKHRLEDEVRREVEGVVGGRIEKAAAGPGSRDQKIVGIPVPSKSGLSAFDRSRQPNFIVEVLGHAESILARPAEAGNRYCASMVKAAASLRLSTPSFVSVTRLHFCPPVKRPPVGRGRPCPSLPLAQGVAVALVVVGGDAGGEEKSASRNTAPVSFCSIDLPFRQHADARLAGRGVELTLRWPGNSPGTELYLEGAPPSRPPFFHQTLFLPRRSHRE